MRKQASFILIVCLLGNATSALAQGGSPASGVTTATQSAFPQFAPNLLPPSPDAYSFTKYGNLPIGLNTGTAQYTLPVYTIQSGSLSHAISIGYSSNGVKVDEMATRVGINWNLRAGGMITRTVMDLPDEAPAVYPTFFHGPITWDTAYETSWDLYDYVRQASFATRPDYQPDEYSFNVDGYSGKFLKRENEEFTQFTSSAMKIEQNVNGFILTAPTGVKYYFYLVEVAKNYSLPENTALEWVPMQMPTAWYLTKILSPNRDSIVFNYTAVNEEPGVQMTYKNGISQDYNTGTSDGFYVNTTNYYLGYRGLYAIDMPYIDRVCGTIGATTLVQLTDNNPACLSSVTFKGGRVNFIYSGRMDVPGEKRLDTVKVIRSADSTLIRCVAMGYTYSQASPGSFDTYIYPGINYTNGDTALRKRLFLTSFDEVATDLSYAQRQSFEYNDINGLPPRLSFSQDRYGSFNGKVNTTYFFPNDTWFDVYIGNNRFGGDRRYNFNHAKKGMLKKIIYPTGGYTRFNYEPNKTEADYDYVYHRDSVFAELDTSSYVGQQDVSDTLHFDDQTQLSLRLFCDWASDPVSTSYNGMDTALEGVYHVKLDVIDVNTNECVYWCDSEMQPGVDVTYGNLWMTWAEGTYRIKLTANRPRLRAKAVLAKSWKTPDRSDSAGIAGVRVKSISDFAADNQETNRREFMYGSWDDSTSGSGTGLNLSVNNGNEVSMTRAIFDFYNCGYNTIHSNSIMTNFLSENNTVLYNKVIELNAAANSKNNGGMEYEFYYDQKNYPIPLSFTWGAEVWSPAPIVPNGAPYMNNDYRTGMIKSSKAFTYQQKYGTRAILQETNNYYSVDTAHLIIDTFLVSREVIKRDGRVPSWIYLWDYDLYRYWRYYGFLKQDSLVQKDYSVAGQLTNKVVFSSYNTGNYKPDSIRFYSSAGDTKKIGRKYIPGMARDFGVYDMMKDANMIDPLVEEKNYVTDREMAQKRMAYGLFNGLLLPWKVYSSQKTGNEYLEITYDQYDSSGNPLQFMGKDSITTTIIWGYNKQYPVAKIAGKTYSTALSESGINMSVVNNPPGDAALQTELNKLRTLGGSLVTTYIYDPLIGVKRQTDPNGRNIYYEYDRFNRLSLVRDQDSNIVKKICYNFQGQPVDCGQGTLAAWQAVSSSCQQVSDSNTGNLVIVEKDMNPASATYNQTRNVIMPNAGACPLCSAICTGNDKKCIGGICRTGIKFYSSAIYTGGHWLCTYFYLWAEDCSVSPYYEETTALEPVLFEPECE